MAYCPQCGEALDEGARFCAECGAPVEARAEAPQSVGTPSGEGGFSRSAPAPSAAVGAAAPIPSRRRPAAAPADETRVIDVRRPGEAPVGGVRPVTAPVSLVSGSTRRMPPVSTPQARPAGSHRPVTYSARNTVSKSRVPLVVGIVVAALLVGAGGFAAITLANRSDGGGGAPSITFLPGDEAADLSAPAPSPEPQDERDPVVPEKLPAAEADPQAAASLTAYYGDLAGLDEKVGAAAQEFNGLYISGSQEEREAALGRCEELRDDIAEARDEVTALGIPAESPYHRCAEDIAALYGDLYQRIDVIVKSWEIDVGFDDPTGHSDEICAPMAAANEGGVSKYLKDYQERYPGADPAKVQG